MRRSLTRNIESNARKTRLLFWLLIPTREYKLDHGFYRMLFFSHKYLVFITNLKNSIIISVLEYDFNQGTHWMIYYVTKVTGIKHNVVLNHSLIKFYGQSNIVIGAYWWNVLLIFLLFCMFFESFFRIRIITWRTQLGFVSVI